MVVCMLYDAILRFYKVQTSNIRRDIVTALETRGFKGISFYLFDCVSFIVPKLSPACDLSGV